MFISRELTELQGGEIGVASKAGEGSTFAFYVKAKRATAPPDTGEATPPALSCRPTTGKSTPAAAQLGTPSTRDFADVDGSAGYTSAKEPLRVLIVEDNLVNQRVLQKQLKNVGCIVTVANHGGEALDRLRESSLWAGHGAGAVDLHVVLMDQGGYKGSARALLFHILLPFLCTHAFVLQKCQSCRARSAQRRFGGSSVRVS